MTDNTPLVDKIVAKVHELNLPEKTEEFLRGADQALGDTVRWVGATTHDHRDKIAAALDKVEKVVDEGTSGKYSEQIGKARAEAEKGVARLADLRGHGAEGAAAGAHAPDAQAAPDAQTDKPTWATVDDRVIGQDEDPLG